jgi:hypothetical protein
MTFTGTAGATVGGATTFNPQNTNGGLVNAINSYTVSRITNLTAANAGQTIIMTVTAIGSSGTIFFDGGWLESKTAPPVIICNIARLTSAGYAIYTAWTGTDTSRDSDVTTTNTALQTMANEFDAMVQIADADTAVNKDATMTNDGIHPNEKGAAAIVDAFVAAVKRLRPSPGACGDTISMNPPQPRAGYARFARRTSYWCGVEDTVPTYSTYTPVAGDLFAVAFEITEPRDLYTKIGTEVTTAGTGSATVRWGIYDDVDRVGYPQQLTPYDPTGTTAFTVPLATGLASQNLLFSWPPDPGLYWLVVKFDTIGTGQVFRSYFGASRYIPQRGTTGVASAIAGCCYKLTGQGTAALAGTFPSGAVPSGSAATTASCPVLQLLKSK